MISKFKSIYDFDFVIIKGKISNTPNFILLFISWLFCQLL
jgi:hypothetical protein